MRLLWVISTHKMSTPLAPAPLFRSLTHSLSRTATLSHERVLKPEELIQEDSVNDTPPVFISPLQRTVSVAPMQSVTAEQPLAAAQSVTAEQPLAAAQSVTAEQPLAAEPSVSMNPMLLNEFAPTPTNQAEALRALFRKIRNTPAVLPGSGLRRTD